MKNIIKERFMYAFSVVFLVVIIGVAQPAMALIGPVDNPPGGVTISDSDPGDGEEWGRVGGRVMTFSNFQLSQFTQLLWGPANINAVSISFDGAVDTPEETLDYADNPEQGKAVWTGQTEVELFTGGSSDGTAGVDTKFILTVTDSNGDPVSLTFDPGTGLPQVDVLNLPPHSSSGEISFTATLEMQARNPSNLHTECPAATPQGEYGPALHVYDCLKTDPSADMPALTSFDWGFFYEQNGGGEIPGDLEEHDAHIAGLIDAIEVKADSLSTHVQFLYDDWLLVKPGLLNNQGDILNGISGLETTLIGNESALSALEAKADIIPARFDDLQNFLNQLPLGSLSDQVSQLPDRNLLLLLFGLEDFVDPAAGLPPFDMIGASSQLYQALNTLNEKSDAIEAKADALESKVDALETGLDDLPTEIELQIVDSLRNIGGNKRLIILLNENGKAVNANIASVEAIMDIGVMVESVPVEFESTKISDGLFEVRLDLNESLKSADIFLIRAEHQVNGGQTILYGAKLLTIQ